MRPSRLAALLAALLPAACDRGGDGAAASWETAVDTIGDTVVVRTVGASDSAAALRLVPELRIGELEGAEEYTFGAIGTLTAAANGGVYVWDRIATTLRHYDSAGTFVRQVGGRGGGPGEYYAANAIRLLPDGRLLLWDPQATRLNLYAADGTPTGSWTSPSSLFTGDHGLYVDTAGTVAVLAWMPRGDGAARASRASPREGVVRLRADGAVLDTLAPALPRVEEAPLTASSNGMTVYSSVPYTPAAVWTYLPSGEFVTGASDRYALTVHRADRPLRIERDAAPIAVHPDEAEDARAHAIGRLRRADPAWRWSGGDVPATKPFFSAVRGTPDGRLWVQRATAGEPMPDDEYDDLVAAQPAITPPLPPPRRWREPTAYDVFAADGRFLGHLPVPPRTTLHHMRGDTAWGVQRDSLDVQYVVRFRVEPSLARRARP